MSKIAGDKIFIFVIISQHLIRARAALISSSVYYVSGLKASLSSKETIDIRVPYTQIRPSQFDRCATPPPTRAPFSMISYNISPWQKAPKKDRQARRVTHGAKRAESHLGGMFRGKKK